MSAGCSGQVANLKKCIQILIFFFLNIGAALSLASVLSVIF